MRATATQPSATIRNDAEVGDCGAERAHAEDAERGAGAFPGIPARDIGDAGREAAARDAHEQGSGQGTGRRSAHRSAGRAPVAAVSITIGITLRPPKRSERMPMNRRETAPVRIGVPTSKPNSRIAKAELLLDFDADDRKDRPHREAGHEGKSACTERLAALVFGNSDLLHHCICPIEGSGVGFLVDVAPGALRSHFRAA